MPTPKISPVGLNGVLVTFDDVLTEDANRAALAFRAAIIALGDARVLESSTSLTSTFVLFDPLQATQADMQAVLSDLAMSQDWTNAPLPQSRKLWRIPARFDGEHAPQLSEAAALAGLSEPDAIAQICAKPLRVLTLGFAPGQPYLGILPKAWDIPRQTGLTKQVPQGAITVAVRQIVLFSNPSPTGWRQVGQCNFQTFRPDSDTPFPLNPGDEIQFYQTDRELATDPDGGADWVDLT